ncbi:single-stranded DNA-binding protein [uncultured Arsenicicoccus sp.]|uniref:single-stranded DNA-binding protein n=1 Tax=uncultured Arsenicicoccus sp. TaxID=491339 RepID=UPI002596A97F|nr:single-stranded DNA-binding protein [uncultured Arsenicicoccus sp.]
MAGETPITLQGNLTADPELTFTPTGVAVAKFTVASTPRTFNKDRNEWVDGDALFLPVEVWRDMAENVAETLTKGTKVVVIGTLRQRSYENRQGERRTVYEVKADNVAVSLLHATAKVSRRGSQAGGRGQGAGWSRPVASQGPPDDPWAAARDNDEPPF